MSEPFPGGRRLRELVCWDEGGRERGLGAERPTSVRPWWCYSRYVSLLWMSLSACGVPLKH